MKRTWAALAAAAAIAAPTTGWAQPTPTALWAREVSAGVGLGHVFVFEGDTVGDRLNIGGSLAVVHRSGVGVELEVNRTLGLSPESVRPILIASINLQYRFFKARRVQPYVTAGLGMMWVKYPHGFGPTRPDMSPQTDVTETGFGPDLGAGLRLSIFGALSVSPEIRWLDAPWLARANLAVTRVVVRTAYSW